MSAMRLVAVTVCVLLLAPALAAHQSQRPNFSGRWAIVQPAKGGGMEQMIKHDDKTLSKTPMSGRGGPPSTYQLDGVERRSVIPMSGQEIVVLTKAAWEANTVVIVTTESYPTGQKLTVREVWSMDTQGRLVIDVTETAERQPPQSMKVILQKKS